MITKQLAKLLGKPGDPYRTVGILFSEVETPLILSYIFLSHSPLVSIMHLMVILICFVAAVAAVVMIRKYEVNDRDISLYQIRNVKVRLYKLMNGIEGVIKILQVIDRDSEPKRKDVVSDALSELHRIMRELE